MHLSSSDLSTYTPTLAAMTVAEIRAALRVARRKRKRDGLTLDRLQENSGVDRAVIHRIESPKKYPKYEAGFHTIHRLIEGLGLTLPDFFLQVERGELSSDSQDSSLQSGKSLGDTASSPSGEAASDGVGSVSAASEKAALRRLRAEFRKLEADLRRMEARDRSRAAARRKKTSSREGVRARRKKAS